MSNFLKYILVLSLISLLFCACGNKDKNLTTAAPQTITEATDAETTVASTETAKNETTKPTTAKAQVTEAETTQKSTYGNSDLSFDPNNKFIKAVVEKYKISAEGLFCSYSNVGKDNNFVFQFDGSKDSNGKLIRNADTLKFVYSVTADCQTICRTGGYTGNDGCSLVNGLGVFMMSQQVLLPNIQDQIDAAS